MIHVCKHINIHIDIKTDIGPIDINRLQRGRHTDIPAETQIYRQRDKNRDAMTDKISVVKKSPETHLDAFDPDVYFFP